MQEDSYYRDASRESIEAVIAEGRAAGKTPEEIRYAIRRAYPFGQRKADSRIYKIWNKLVHEAEANLGLEKKRHKNSKAKPAEPVVDPIDTLRRAIDDGFRGYRQV